MDRQRKLELGEKYKHSLLMQLLLFSVWARVLLVIFILLILSVAIVLPKIWNVSPSHFLPKVRISILDMMQAKSLKRQAEKASEQGKIDDALYAWIAAWANHRCDPDLARGYLGTTLKMDQPEKNAPTIFYISSWLLRLTQTNRLDLELCVQALHAADIDNAVVNLLRPFEKDLNGVMAACYLKALFNQGEIPRFKDVWERYEGKVASDLELDLAKTAYTAGWGDPSEAAQAQAELEQASKRDDAKSLANHYLLRIAYQKSNLDMAEQAIGRLVDARIDVLSDHLAFWNLLLVMGEKDKALSLIQNSATAPNNAFETIELSRLFLRLDQNRQAMQTLKWYLDQRGFDVSVAMFYANLLVQAQDWPELNTLALSVRGQEGTSQAIEMWSYLIEGRVEIGRGRREYANTAFDKLSQIDCDDPQLGAQIGYELLQLGYATQSQVVLSKLESHFEKVPDFWIALSVAAGANKNVENMEQAARKAYELAPDNIAAVNNYAAVLIARRTKPAEAIKLTLQLFQRNPNFIPIRINHAEALILNGRFDEAERLLTAVDARQLNAADSQQFYLDWYQIYYAKGRYNDAREMAKKIREEELFPAQVAWFREAQKQMK